MSFGKIFLIVAWIISFETTCSACCDDNDCSHWISENKCNEDVRCKWAESKCRDVTYSDFNNNEVKCKDNFGVYSGTTCSAPTKCGDFDELICDIITNFNCTWVGGVCKVAVCGDFANTDKATCENNHKGIDAPCKYNDADGRCTLTTACADWTDREAAICNGKFVGGVQCRYLDEQCRDLLCSYFVGPNCEASTTHDTGIGYCKSNADGSCTPSTSCGDWTDRGATICNNIYFSPFWCSFYGDKCQLQTCEHLQPSYCVVVNGCTLRSDGLCHTATSCSAWDGQNKFNCTNGIIDGNQACVWKESDSTCSAKPSCGSWTSDDDCNNPDNKCYLMEKCSIDEPSSHAIFIRASSLLVVLLLTLLV